jgi:chromosome segregation protein
LLKLKRVEIHGFKSFFDKTEMRFNGSGIAAIVGPNGCGKSNLSDAISWVLGEQSAKSLRGTRMEDVIFAGTRDRKPLGMASVTMTLAGAPGPEDAEAASSNGNGSREITITRRLFRDGESEYLINGKAARLRDIQDLFLGTGLGPESYAIIEQGRIGQILSNRPQDRRAVIEEAAGVTRFKTKRRLAEAKLEGAKQNLNRVFDILEEVTRQVNSLKRQAAKAKRYGELKSELDAHLRRMLAGKFRILEREAARTAIELSVAQSELQGLNDSVMEKETAHAALQERAYAVEAELTAARARLSELRLELERTRGRLDSQARQIASIDSRLSQGGIEREGIDGQARAQQQELAALTAQAAELDREAAEVQERLTAKGAERDALRLSLEERTRGLEAGRQKVLRLLGEASSLRNQLAKLDEYLAAVERDAARTRQDEDAAAADAARLARQRAELSEQVKARQLDLEAVSVERKSLEAQLAASRDQVTALRRQLDQARSEGSQWEARRRSLQEVLSHRSYTAESVKRLFGEQTRDGFQPLGVLADFLEVDPRAEKAAEEFLHDELEYVVVDGWDGASAGIELMRQGLDGRATFLVHPEPQEARQDPAAADLCARPGVTGLLRDHVRLTNGLSAAPADMLPRLAGCVLVENHETARALAVEFPGRYFLLPDGVSYHGHTVSGGKKTGAGPLQLKRELREVSAKAREAGQRIEQTAAALEAAERAAASLAEALDRARAQQQLREKEALALEHEARKLSEEANRCAQRLSVARLELERLALEGERSRARRTETAALAEEREAERKAQEEALDASRAGIEQSQAEAARLAEEHAALRAAQAALDERRRAVRAGIGRQETALRELARRREELTAEMERLGRDRTRLLDDNASLDARASELAASVESTSAEGERLAVAETELRASLAASEETLKDLRSAAQTAQERRGQIELTLVRLQAELRFLDETSRKELNIPVAELSAGAEAAPDEQGLEEIETSCNELRAKIDSLGPVNPQALEEFQEAQQRYDFLNVQRQDLLEAIRDTERAIQDIDAETRKRFAEAFEAINANFREMFKTLFGGGMAEMRLTDEANAAESGIDIIASPPGKRLQNVLLLSGGEKSLTAMALLMAIFRYQPSPFCILDEIDAPLDEANIVRLTRLLRDMSDQTQFVVITHAKRTMEAAQALYGVTMQEPGVSKLVSVKFQAATPPPPVPEMELAAAEV